VKRVNVFGPWRGNPGNAGRISALGRYARNYAGETLRMAASDLVDLYESKHLDRDVLAAIARSLFYASPPTLTAAASGHPKVYTGHFRPGPSSWLGGWVVGSCFGSRVRWCV